MRKYLFLLLFAAPLFLGLTSYQSASDKRLSVFDDYPIPTDKNMLFYIQKSYNKNTVVYCANINEEGKLDPKEPVIVFWRRYQENGQKRELKYFEKKFGFGIHAKAVKGKNNTYLFKLVSLKKMTFIISQDKNGKPKLITTIDKKYAHIDRVFVKSEHVKLIPKVFYVEVFGRELNSNQFVYEKFNQD